MNVNRRLLYGGVFLVAAGAVMLAAQGDVVGDDVIAQALRLWPIVLIALGVGLLLRRTRFGVAGGMLAAAMPGLLLGGVVVAAPQVGLECSDIQPATFVTRQGTFEGPASVELELRCGELSVSTAPGTAWQLEAGNATGAAASVDGSANRLRVVTSDQARPFGPFRGSDAWRLSLPTATSLDLSAEVYAGRARFDLAGAQLGSVQLGVNAADARVDLARASVAHLSMSVNAGSATLYLSAAQDLGADLDVNAGAITICAPSELGLRIRHEGVLSATTYNGLARSGETWESPGYSMANHHADVTITANVGSVDMNPVGGCQ